MTNSFLFIIPLTPASHLTKVREELQEKCLTALKNQEYDNWKALLIGAEKPTAVEDNRFIHLPTEGVKGFKIECALEYLVEKKKEFDYLIRLDDDDIISSTILEQYQSSNADVIVDLEHWYIDWTTKNVSKDFKPWFANTCILKYNCAVSKFKGSKNKDSKNNLTLIENDHSTFHEFFKGKNIAYTESKSPIYLRVLNTDSITSRSDSSYAEYLKKYGDWNQDTPKGFTNSSDLNNKKNKTSFKKEIFSNFNKMKFKISLK